MPPYKKGVTRTPDPGHPNASTLNRYVSSPTVPRLDGVHHDQQLQLAALIQQARAMVAALAEQAKAERRAFEEGYRLGFGAGVDVGQEREQAAEERRAAAQAEAIDRFARVRPIAVLDAIGQPAGGGRYPQYTPAQLLLLRGRDHYPLADRTCSRCDGRGIIPGGIA